MKLLETIKKRKLQNLRLYLLSGEKVIYSSNKQRPERLRSRERIAIQAAKKDWRIVKRAYRKHAIPPDIEPEIMDYLLNG